MSKKNIGSTLRFVDIDETVFHTTAEVKIRLAESGALIASLSNQEWNAYPREGIRSKTEIADFSEFSSSEKFFRESLPIEPMVSKLQEWSYKMRTDIKYADDMVVFVTARGDFDDRELFLDTFRQHRIAIDDERHFYVSRTGNLSDDARINHLPLSTAQRKKIVYLARLMDEMPDIAELYEDDLANIKDFLQLKKEMPSIKYRAFLVKNGTVRQIFEKR